MPLPWTRRAFSQTFAAAVASAWLPSNAFTRAPAQTPHRAYVSSLEAGGAIHLFEVGPRQWTPRQNVPAPSVVHLEQHPYLHILYALHGTTEWDHLPRGAVSAWAIAATGELSHLYTQPLALSASAPEHARVTADGSRSS